MFPGHGEQTQGRGRCSFTRALNSLTTTTDKETTTANMLKFGSKALLIEGKTAPMEKIELEVDNGIVQYVPNRKAQSAARHDDGKTCLLEILDTAGQEVLFPFYILPAPPPLPLFVLLSFPPSPFERCLS